MANKDQPKGFQPWGGLKEVRPMQAQTYNVSTAPAIFVYDLVARADDGYIDTAAAQSVYIVGSALTPRTTADSAAKPILVASDPFQMFIAQADGSDLSSITYVGNNCDHLATTGNTSTFLSKHEIDSSENAAGAAGVQIEALDDRPDNDWGEFCDCIVTIYEHYYGRGGTQYI